MPVESEINFLLFELVLVVAGLLILSMNTHVEVFLTFLLVGFMSNLIVILN